MKKRNHHFCIASLVSLCFLVKTDLIQAQVTSDGTLSTQVTTTDNLDFTIINGNKVGSNLFHSFREFSVPTGGSASFANDLDVKNIINRVTGGSISNIDGLIKTNGSANLFLINPNGIVFGPNASLNINGSFFASTAHSINFADGTQFSATNPQTAPLLTVNLPIGLQFGQTAQSIQIEGSNLQVLPGQTLAMLGGDVSVKGSRLFAPAGRIELGSVAPNSFVNLTPIVEGWALGYDGVQHFQDMQISQAAFIDTTGEGNGAMQLRGRNIAITSNSIVGGVTTGDKPGQPLTITASESVEVSGSSQDSASQLSTVTKATGAASDINIATKRLILRDGGIIETSTNGSGPGGNLTVNASESLQVLGGRDFSSLSVRSLSTDKDAGDAGTVQISTKNLILRDGGQILTSTLGAGNGGTLIVNAFESVEANGLIVLPRARFDTNGQIVIENINFPSGLLAQTIKFGFVTPTGKGGDIIINTQGLVIKDGASISVAAVNGSRGQAGTLDINASDFVTVTGSAIGRNNQTVPSTLLARSEGPGSAGDLRINTGKLTVQNGAEINANSQGSGRAGNLDITTDNLLLDNQGKLTANTTGGQGNINLHSGTLILRRGSGITTNATGNNVTGGNINIDTDNLVAVPQENSDITANSQDFRGGNVTINAQAIFGTQFQLKPTPLSDITATGANSQLNGNVQINIPDVDPSSGLVELSNIPIDRTQQIAQACSADQGNKFIITGRGGLPYLPNEALRTQNTVPLPWVRLDHRQVERRRESLPKSPISNQIVEATGWVVDKSGEVVLVAANTTPVSSWSTPAVCPGADNPTRLTAP
ncbi:filamentous hemagglutinin N-terminal domain-containing protein [Fischerella sp. JS2]|uniref:two-partner secretion domain-containing protein n=1 Tax=Fischerella sp. JS2 TaxID=2597771 RepID=UPI0028EFA55C|nr:filamentous hemagglutinin N-terminal domain-containing protein [Fischerella sp. JS2]